MPLTYLNTNAVLYGVLGLLCALAPGPIAHSVGFSASSSSGPLEYLIMYGAFQCALAVLFVQFARARQSVQLLGFELGIALALLVVSYQLIARLFGWPESIFTVLMGIVGLALLVWGVALLAIARAPYAGG